MCAGLLVKYPLVLAGFKETQIFSADFRKKYSNNEFHENPSSGNRDFPCGRTDIMKLKAAFLSFVKGSRKKERHGRYSERYMAGNSKCSSRFGILTTGSFKYVANCTLTPSRSVGYLQCFRGTCGCHLQVEINKVQAAKVYTRCSLPVVLFCHIPWKEPTWKNNILSKTFRHQIVSSPFKPEAASFGSP